MKQASKVLIIISLVLVSISAVIFLTIGIGALSGFIPFDSIPMTVNGIHYEPGEMSSEEIAIVSNIFGIVYTVAGATILVPIVVNILTLLRLNKPATKKELLPYGILEIVIGGGTLSLIAGILLLIIKDEELL